MSVRECRMCGAQQALSYLFLPGCERYLEYLNEYTKTLVHDQDKQPPYICRNCEKWLDGYYAMKKELDKNGRTCQQHPANAKLKLDDDDPYINISEELDLQPLRKIPEELDAHNQPINNMQRYQCAHCNCIFENKDVMSQHLIEVHLIRCTFHSRCQIHCPIKPKYSKVTMHKDPTTNTVIGTTLMGTSGQFWKVPSSLDPQKPYLTTDRVLPMLGDDIARNMDGLEMDVVYKCHKCRRDFISSWKVEQHILIEHMIDDRCSKCLIHCQTTRQKQEIWVRRLRNTKAQKAQNEVHYLIGLTDYSKSIDLS